MFARRHVPLSDFEGQLVTVEEDPLEVSELYETVRRCFEELPSHEREALAAFARIGSDSCRDVAERYGKKVQTIYARAHVACRKLKPLLETVR